MANVSHNASLDSDYNCEHSQVSTLFFALSDVLAFLVGLPVFAKLLWLNVRSRRPTDILNFNLALFHGVQYLLCGCHLLLVKWQPETHRLFIRMVVIYAQVGGPMSLSFICMERYVAVIHPTSYPLLKAYRWRELCSVAVWLTSVVTTLVVCVPNRDLDAGIRDLLKVFPIVLMCIMIEVMTFCTVCISRALKRSGPGQDKLHPMKRRAFVTVCATTAITVFCYIPVTMLQRVDGDVAAPLQCVFTGVNMLLLSAASVVHPMFYLHTQGALHLCWRRQKKGP